jgi:hypothetical protein
MRAPTINPRVLALTATRAALNPTNAVAVTTVDSTLFPAGRKPPPDESSRDEGNHGQDGHSVDPQ